MDAGALALAIPADHPAYDGHFPGRPLLPGVVILAEVLAAAERLTARPPHRWRVAQVKFLAPVAPGTALTLAHALEDGGALRFEVRAPSGVVASGRLAPAP